jgi:hypothetical protein
MASLRRSKALSPDGQTARFLYTILKQLDLKTIDWNLVANGLDITNGHAARMRFSRFKQHMEGIPTQPRTPRPKKDGGKDKNAKGKGLKRRLEDDIKGEDMKGEDGVVDEARVKPELGCRIKDEPGMNEEGNGMEGPPAVRVKREPEADGIASQPNGTPVCLALPVQSQELVPATNLELAPPTAMTTQAKAPIISPPPIATVSLADLQLSPNSVPHAPRFDRAAPNFVFAARPATSRAHRDVIVTGIKSEPGLMSSPAQAAGGLPHVKSEPIGP